MTGYSSGKYPISVKVLFFVECKIKMWLLCENCSYLWFCGNENWITGNRHEKSHMVIDD
jgi:hypothetical protein